MQVNGVENILSQIRTLSEQSSTPVERPAQLGQSPQVERSSFSNALMKSVDQVNDLQSKAASMATALERGEPGVDVAQVMVAMQKASIGFQAMTQVRNRMISVYQDVMNMPV